jgi:hypothetical protein
MISWKKLDQNGAALSVNGSVQIDNKIYQPPFKPFLHI